MIPSKIAEKSIGYSSSISVVLGIINWQKLCAKTQGPTTPKAGPHLTLEQKAKQDKIMQQFYPNYMVDNGIRPGSHPMYLTIDKDPSFPFTYSSIWSILDVFYWGCCSNSLLYSKWTIL